MIFQCGDLERALRTPELMPDARAHAERCTQCREQLSLWGEISRIAPQLHEEWESPALWPRIREGLAAEPARKPRTHLGRWALAAAATVALAGVMLSPRPGAKPPAGELLTDAALQEVQRAETAYVRSIDKLAAVADPAIQHSPAPVASAYREKLLLLDSAIAELKASVEQNRYNAYLRGELASLYGDKKKTLQEWMNYAKRN